MRAEISKKDRISQIIYAESLNRLLLKNYFSELTEARSVLFVSTQPFYERYYEKLTNLLKKNGQYQWYICPSNDTVNSINMYQKLLTFIEEMKLPEKTLIIGAGDSPIFHLCGVLKETSPFFYHYTYIPTTITGFMQSLEGQAYLLNHSLAIVMKQFTLPERVVYDTMLNELESIDSWTMDFYSLVNLGVCHQPELLKELYQASLSEKHAVFSPFLKSIVEIFQQESLASVPYGLSFARSFYQLKESHYLSRNQKVYIGFLLQTLWGILSSNLTFEFTKFYRWFEGIVGINLALPRQMVTYDLAESIVNELTRFENVECLKAIGLVQKKANPTIEEIYEVIDKYRNLNKND